MKRSLLIVSLILVCLFRSLPVHAADDLVIGLIPEENIFEEIKRFRTITDYLSRRTGIRIKVIILSRYGDVIDRFTMRKMDGAFFGYFTSVLAMDKLKVVPVARPVRPDGQSTVQSFLFVRKDSGIKSVGDMKGKRIAFVDRATVTGYLYALAYLRDNGVRDADSFFRDVFFTGNHDSTILAVLDNRADIGVAKSKQFLMQQAHDPLIKEELTVVAESPPLPDITLCLRGDLPDEVMKMLRDAMLRMHEDPDGNAILKKAGMLRFDVATEADFRGFQDLSRRAGISLKTYRYK